MDDIPLRPDNSVVYDPNHDKIFVRILDGEYSLCHHDQSRTTTEEVGAVFDVWQAGWGEPIGIIECYQGAWYVVGDAFRVNLPTAEAIVQLMVGE